MCPEERLHMPQYEIVLRRPYQDDEVQLREFKGWDDGSSVEIDGLDWFVMMHVPPQGTGSKGRLICVRADAGEGT
jgi:hypothetical protein